MYAYRQLGDHAVEIDTYLGKCVPIHASAAGPGVLSKLPADATEAILGERGLGACTPETITHRRALRDERREIEECGRSTTDQGIVEWLRAVGAPILGPEKEAVGARPSSVSPRY